MVDLNSIDLPMLLTSKYKKYFDNEPKEIEQHAKTMRIILDKIQYLNNTRNKTTEDLYECGAIFFTLFTAPTWVWIGCDEVFEENHHLCERKVVKTRRSKYTYIRNESWCQHGYVYAGERCWTNVNKISKGDEQFNFSTPLNIQLESYLSAWSLGHTSRMDIIIGRSGVFWSCLSSVAFTYQRTRQWVINNRCVLAQQNQMYSLLIENLITSKLKCKQQSLYMCDDKTCIMNAYVCDGKTDCSDGKDEVDCDDTCLKQHINVNSSSDMVAANRSCVCGVLYFQCNSGLCITLHSKCDGLQDCFDGVDEMFCLLDPIDKNVLNYQQKYVDYQVCIKTK